MGFRPYTKAHGQQCPLVAARCVNAAHLRREIRLGRTQLCSCVGAPNPDC